MNGNGGTAPRGSASLAHLWYVAQTKPNAETAAIDRLCRQGFVTHLPYATTRRTVGHGPRRHHAWFAEPLFRSYLFVLLEVGNPDNERWKSVNNTRSILTLLPRSDSPLPLPAHEIEELHEAELAGNFVRPRHIRPGTRLKPRAGSLADQVMECLDSDDHKGTIRALWDCMGAKRVVTLASDDVLLTT